MTTKKKLKPKLKLNPYDVVKEAVYDGIVYGYRRAYKYEENPEVEAVLNKIHQEVLNSLCQVVEFEEEPPTRVFRARTPSDWEERVAGTDVEE